MTARSVVSTLAVLAVAGAASADKGGFGQHVTGTGLYKGTNVGTYGGASPSGGFEIFIPTEGVESWDPQGDADNVTMDIDLGVADAQVTGIGWDVTLETFDPSWLSEPVATFEDSLNLTPGAGDDFSGVMNYSSGGIIDLVGEGLDFNVGPDGVVHIEFWENFDDFPDEIDALWTEGGITLTYIPAPASLALLGFGGLVAARRRR